MNSSEHIPTVLGEECAEVAKEISKALRFGLEDRVTLDPKGPRGTDGPTNRQKIVQELNDLLGVVRLCVDQGILPMNWENLSLQAAKAVRVVSFMGYADRVGALDGGVPTPTWLGVA